VYQGRTNKIIFDFASDQLKGAPISVTFTNVPNGVILAPTNGQERGKRESELSAHLTAPIGIYPVSATASAHVDGETVQSTATFTVHVEAEPKPQADIVFVLDVTSSMQVAINGVRDGIKSFADGLDPKRLDFRLGLVAFRDLEEGEPSEVLRFKPDSSPFTTDPEEFKQQVNRLRADGGGDVEESALDAICEAAELPLRLKSTKVLLLITDAPPKLPDRRVKILKDVQEVLRERQIDQLHIVSHPSPRIRRKYEQLWDGRTGQYFNLEAISRNDDSFNRLLPELSKVIATAAVASRPTAQLAAAPPKAALAAQQGLQSSRAYDARAQGQLLFAISVWTAAIAAAISLALAAVQYLSLNRRPSAKALLLSLGGGALAGLVGGAVGQGLFMLASGNPLAAALFRVVGWAALGGLAGCGLAFVVPNLQKPHGLVGGLLGGGIGAVGYMLAAYIGLGDFVGRLAGALILGFFIGLMVALVEAVLRRAWLEVRFGGGEVIAVNLGPEPVKVGGDGQQCAVWARGAPPVALRYWLRGPQVFCHDVATGQERAVAGGDYRRAGGVEVTVRTSASGTAQATGTKPTVLVDEEPEVAVRPRAIRPTTQPPPVAPTPPKQPPLVAPPPTRPAAPAAKSHRCPACGIGVEKPHGICPSCGEMY
jgi:Mg-chelatase subunit ChlD